MSAPLDSIMTRRSANTLTRLVAFIVCACAATGCAARAGEPAGSGPGPGAGLNAPPTRPSAALADEDPDTPLIELDGSISISPDGSELSYRWAQLSGPRVMLSDPHSARPRFRTNTPGSYEFQLVVSANGLDSEPYVVRLEIERENLPPVARVNVAETWGQVGKPMQLDGSASFDPEGEMLLYQWRLLTPGLTIPQDALRKPVLVVQPDADGMFEVELIVSDGEKVSPPVRARLGVKPRPLPPVAQARIVTVTIPSGVTASSGGMPAADIAAMASPRAEETALRPAPAVPVPVIAVTGDRAGATAVAPAAAAPPPALAPPPLLEPPPRTPAPASASGTALAPASVPEPAPTPVPASSFRPSAGAEPQPALMAMAAPPLPSMGGSSILTLREREKTPAEKLPEIPPGEPAPAPARAVPGGTDPGMPVAMVVAPAHAFTGSLVRMDAMRSYDPKGAPLIYRWRQTGGPRVTKYAIDERLGDAAPGFRPEKPGLYSFSLSVFNGTKASEPIDIDIAVSASPRMERPPPAESRAQSAHAPERSLRRVPELTPLPNSRPPPARFPRPDFGGARDRPAAEVLLGGGRK